MKMGSKVSNVGSQNRVTLFNIDFDIIYLIVYYMFLPVQKIKIYVSTLNWRDEIWGRDNYNIQFLGPFIWGLNKTYFEYEF